MESGLKEYRDYLKLKSYKENTIKYLLKSAVEYEEFVSRTTKDAKAYLSYLETRKHKNNPARLLSKSSLNMHIYGLRVYFRYLENIKGRQVSVYLLSYKVESKKIAVLSPIEVELLFKHAEALRDKVVLVCLYDLGLRILEVAGLKVEDIDLKERLVFVSKSKTGRQREVPMSKRSYKILGVYLKDRTQEKESLLQGLKGSLGVHGIRLILKKIVARSAIEKKVYPHLLRHSIATHLVYSGIEIELLSLFLGHASLESTQRYMHLIRDYKTRSKT